MDRCGCRRWSPDVPASCSPRPTLSRAAGSAKSERGPGSGRRDDVACAIRWSTPDSNSRHPPVQIVRHNCAGQPARHSEPNGGSGTLVARCSEPNGGFCRPARPRGSGRPDLRRPDRCNGGRSGRPGNPARSRTDSRRTSSGAAGRPATPRSPLVIVLASMGCTPASRLAIRCKQQRAFGSGTHEGDDALQVVDGTELDNNAALAAT